VEKGAGAILVSAQRTQRSLVVPPEVVVVEARDTLYALGDLAGFRRRRYSIPIVGITGSNGKTSTKEMVAGVLGHNKQVLKNKGNFNNLIGVPLTLLQLGPNHQAAVVEMGINVPGEMARLVRACRPTVGLITNIHPAHLEGLQSTDRILEEKGILWSELGEEDLAVVNLDDCLLSSYSKKVKARTITYSSKSPAADVKLIGEIEIRNGSSLFKMDLGGTVVSVCLPVLGRHQVQNSLAAAAVAWGLGESPETIARCLSNHQAVGQRMQTRPLQGGGILVDDTYNANPASMLAAIQAVGAACQGRPFVAVLGDMRELGSQSAELHREVGSRIPAYGVTHLITLGQMAGEISSGAKDSGMNPEACFHAQSHEEAIAWLLEKRPADSWVLVKGSRGMTMEKIVEGIVGQ
jgi:UDP-N-acetylmuramoyl-tripeptide--D-alanyl-D-alanine ligase